MTTHIRFQSLVLSISVLLVTACSTAPPQPITSISPITPAASPAQIVATPPSCPVCVPCALCAPLPNAGKLGDSPDTPQPVAFPDPTRGRLERASWSAIPNWGADDPTDTLAAFLQGCPVLKIQPAWADVCAKGAVLQLRMDGRPASEKKASSTQFFATEFEPYQTVNADNSQTGIVTGYYEPLLRGSRTPTPEFRHPLYASPQDLISIDMGQLYLFEIQIFGLHFLIV